jgi:hypothetical protein
MRIGYDTRLAGTPINLALGAPCQTVAWFEYYVGTWRQAPAKAHVF